MSDFNSFADLLISLKQYQKNKVLDSRLTLKDNKIQLKVASGQNELVNSEGGFLVSGEIITPILRSIAQKATLWNKATKCYCKTGKVNEAWIPYLSETARTDSAFQLKSYWLAEAAAKTSAKYSFGVQRINLNKVYSVICVSDELWSDSPALQTFIEEAVTSEKDDALIWKIEGAMLTGDGTTSMYGIMSADTSGTIGVATADPLDEATLLLYVKALAPATLATSEWYVSKENWNDILSITFTNENVMTFEDGRMILFGMPVNVMEQMVSPNDIMLGDVSQYAVALKEGDLIQKAVSIHCKFLNDEKTIRLGIRLNGKSFGSTYTLEDGTSVGTFVIPAGSPAQESSSSSSSSGEYSSSSSKSISSSSSSSKSNSSQSQSSESSAGRSDLTSQSLSTQSESSESSGDYSQSSLSSASSEGITSESSGNYSESSSSMSSGALQGCAEDYCASFDSPLPNISGTYSATGSLYNSKAIYYNGYYYIWYDGVSGYWALSADLGDPQISWISTTDTAVGCPDGDLWVDVTGAVVEGKCTQGGPN